MEYSLEKFNAALHTIPGAHWSGRVVQVVGSIVASEGPLCGVGESCTILCANGSELPGEIIGFHGPTVLSMPLRPSQGIRHGDMVVARGEFPKVSVSHQMLGRVLDGSGTPFDGLGPIRQGLAVPLRARPINALERLPIREPLSCGIRAIDALLTCGCGQRIGIFGGSGVGKTTLISMMARGTSADVIVLGLVGERGREVGEFLEELGPEGRERSVVVVSTSDESPLLRIRAALVATSIAEGFAALGRNVLLVVDSLTRFAMAQREIGLLAGEPPTSKGYTPSVFSALAQLVERAGRFTTGSITAFYTVLMEGDDQQDPLVDAVRSLLDGHVVLDRKLATANHYPAISVLDSLSRLMPAVAAPEHLERAAATRRMLAHYGSAEDLIRLGAYQSGTDPELDHAIAAVPHIRKFLRQSADERFPLESSVRALLELPI